MHYIFWFRKDLRLTDNRALSKFLKAVGKENKFSFLYIKNRNTFNYFGEMRISFLLECLSELRKDLRVLSLDLNVIEGTSEEVFKKLLSVHAKICLFVNEQIEPYCIGRDEKVREMIESKGGVYNSFTDTTIFKPGEVKNGSGKQYKVFTPFMNQIFNILTPGHYKKIDCDLNCLDNSKEVALKIANKFSINEPFSKLSKSVLLKGGRSEGLKALKAFYENHLEQYKTKRDFPSVIGTSLLSAHLHFGTIGIREVLRTAFTKLSSVKSGFKKIEVQTWIKELMWREFYYHVTFNNPQIIFESFRKEFDKLKWSYDEDMFAKWCDGKTGYPIVDAGMRQLNQEGWMHNRVRMITAMFLTKDLFIDWRWGEKYFAEKLIDLDFANNNGGWQWSASTGVDAQPYFRVFNPYLQSKKFDSEGVYIRKYVPELKNVPKEFIHEPNLMSKPEQSMYKVIIGKDYPEPLIDHVKARNRVIKEFSKINTLFEISF